MYITIPYHFADFKAICTHFRVAGEVVAVNQLNITLFYQKYCYLTTASNI